MGGTIVFLITVIYVLIGCGVLYHIQGDENPAKWESLTVILFWPLFLGWTVVCSLVCLWRRL